MRLSYCLPCHNRLGDLQAVLPSVIAAANASPPIEIVIVDYANEAPLLFPVLCADDLQAPNALCLSVYRGRTHFHMAHARNYALRAATGDYVMIASADFKPHVSLFRHVRERLAESGATWIEPTPKYGEAFVCQRDELIAAGGYDERFEFYGPEGKELRERLTRRGTPHAFFSSDYLSVIKTPDAVKTTGYRLPLNKREMHAQGLAILQDNRFHDCHAANEGLAWGQ